ncbi:MAG: rhamnan synthesis F family protein [Chthoniobacterales bacterium]
MVRKILTKFLLRNTPFDPQWYLSAYPDVQDAGMDPYIHFWYCGRYEGRKGVGEITSTQNDPIIIDPKKETILLILHEGSYTGAPILGYNIALHFLEKYNVICTYFKDGPIIQLIKDAGAQIIGPIPRAYKENFVKKMVKSASIKYAIINSIESRYILKELLAEKIPTISLIHEFLTYINPKSAFLDTLFYSGYTIFSTQLTRRNALSYFPSLKLKEQNLPILPQGKCQLPPSQEVSFVEKEKIKKVMKPKNFSKEGLVVLGAGSCQYRKGVDSFIEIAAMTQKKDPQIPIRFVWVGSGYDPEKDIHYSAYLADQIQRVGLEKDIFFLKEVKNIEALYDLTDIFLLSSRLDPLPNVAIDVLSKGIPLVCFDKTTGIAETLKNNGLGQCVADYLDIDEMAQKILTLARSSSLRKEISERSKKIAAQQFNMIHYIQKIDYYGTQAASNFFKEEEEVEIIKKANVLDEAFINDSNNDSINLNETAKRYIRFWKSGAYRRKPFAEFHPGIYQEECMQSIDSLNPLVHFINSGRPSGRWSSNLITNKEKVHAIPSELRIGLQIHTYYHEMLLDIINRLNLNRVRPDLLLSVNQPIKNSDVLYFLEKYSGRVEVRIVENRGRDLGPFLTEFHEEIQANYDIIGHFHTKKTIDQKDISIGKRWFDFLLENLLGGKAPMADIIIGKMAQDKKIGLVFPSDPHINGWDKNQDIGKKILQQLGIKECYQEFNFPIGNMFWARTVALKPLFELNLKNEDYPEEPLPHDGTILHALERITPTVVKKEGYEVVMSYVEGVTR